MAGDRVQRLRGRAGVEQRRRRMERSGWLCEMCLAEGRTTLATVVNHKVPLAKGGSDLDSNTENLCARHDAEVTARQFGHRAPINDRGVDVEGRPSAPGHLWNRNGTVAGGGSNP